jgi:cobalt-zinc-cadmium efflux system outer membrane protein
MMRTFFSSVSRGFAFTLLVGCASTSVKPSHDEVARTVAARSGLTLKDPLTRIEDPSTSRALDALLSEELTAERSVQIALFASPRLETKLEELSISRAEFVQAGLLANPVIGVGITAWESEHISPNFFASVEQNFLDALTMPLRKRVAETELEATKLEVGDEVLRLAAETREAFFTAQAAEQIAAMRRLIESAAETSAAVARKQHEAGNMNDLALSAELGLAAQSTVERRRAEGDAAVAREHLNRAMGTWGPRARWTFAKKLPDPPKEEPSFDHLESSAIADRLDLGSLRRNLQAIRYALDAAKTTRWTGTVHVAVVAGRLRHSQRLAFGPSVAIEIPLFDQRQAQIAKLEAHERQAESELRALAIDVRAEVRAAVVRVRTARGLVDDYGRVIIPLRERIVRFSQEQYDAMLLGVYQLILAKQNEFEAYRAYIEALRDYWIARSDLERAIGRRLDPMPAPSARENP